jgi:hypothetical protein
MQNQIWIPVLRHVGIVSFIGSEYNGFQTQTIRIPSEDLANKNAYKLQGKQKENNVPCPAMAKKDKMVAIQDALEVSKICRD